MRRELMVVLIMLLAGCSGLNSGAPPTQTTNAEAPVQTSTAGPSDGSPADPSPSNTVNYTALSPAEQRAFNVAQGGEIGFAPAAVRESPYVNQSYVPPEFKAVFENHKYVLKNGSYYQLSWEIGPIIAAYDIQATEQTPPAKASIVPRDELSHQVREPIRRAIENGTHETPFGKWDSLPESLDGIDYVRDGETYYKIDILVGDVWVSKMSANQTGRQTTDR